MLPMNRRSFLKGSAAGAVMTAAGLFPRIVFADSASGIRYRELGKTGDKVSEIGFGAMNTRDPELIHAAIDAGINYIDTAWKYMNGVNEQVIGTVMKTKRDKVFLTTKVPEVDLPAIPKSIEESLKRLNTDHVDLLLAHGLHERDWLENEELIEHLVEAKRRGQTRFIGYSTHKFPDEYLETTLKVGVWDAVLVSYNYLSPSEVTKNIQKAREAGIAVIAMKTLMKGDGKPVEESDSITPNQSALQWVLNNPYVDTVIPGMTAFEHLTEDLAVMRMKLSWHDTENLRRYGTAIDTTYCRGVLGCTGCEDQCPMGVRVSEINRCLGYALGYNDTRLARENYRDLPASSKIDRCAGCDVCQVKCAHGLNLTENIRRARSLFV